MGRLGIGTDRTAIRTKVRKAHAPQPTISPSPAWTGTVGSGFGGPFGAIPTDPIRTSAKPACRLIVLPNEIYTSSHWIGVYAGANHGGDMLNSMGLQHVIFHFEGNTVTVSAPSFRTLTDANGVERNYFGWWVEAVNDGRYGAGHLYVEAVARDPSMQARVIGPYTFLPKPELFDHDLTVEPSRHTVAGSRYPSIAAATNYLRTLDFDNARITLKEPGIYDPNGGYGLNLGTDKGRIVIEASAPVTIRGSTPQANNYWLRPKCEPVCWRGSNITIDFVNSAQYYFEPGYANNRNAFDGCRITTSGGRESLFLKMSHAMTPNLTTGRQWFTEVDLEWLPNVTVGANLIRGIRGSQTYGDYNSSSMVGSHISDHDSRWHTTPIGALELSYNGVGSVATLEKSKSGFNRIFAAKVDGNVVGSLTIEASFNAAISDTQFSVSHVALWLNGLPGWSASVLDNTRAGWTLYPGSGVIGGSFSPITISNTPRTLSTAFDVHGDIAQIYNAENIVFADNVVIDSDVQMIFFKDGYVRDALVLNNGLDNKNGNNFSQFADVQSHVVIAHNSWSKQGVSFRTDFNGPSPTAKYNPDNYCIFTHNVCPTLSWGGPSDGDLAISDNHLASVGTAPTSSTGTTIGGDATSLFAAANKGDFSPTGDLLLNKVRPVLAFGLGGMPRVTTGQGSPKGAVA